MSPWRAFVAIPSAAALVVVAARAHAEEPLARAAIVAAVKARLPDVSACYQKALARKPWLAGRVVASFTIDGKGRVERVEIERTDLADLRFLSCAQDAARAWTFPSPVGGAAFALSYPFVFGEGEGARDPSVLVDGRPRPETLPARCKLPTECRELGASLAFGLVRGAAVRGQGAGGVQ
jgi:hypothetical protein